MKMGLEFRFKKNIIISSRKSLGEGSMLKKNWVLATNLTFIIPISNLLISSIFNYYNRVHGLHNPVAKI